MFAVFWAQAFVDIWLHTSCEQGKHAWPYHICLFYTTISSWDCDHAAPCLICSSWYWCPLSYSFKTIPVVKWQYILIISLLKGYLNNLKFLHNVLAWYLNGRHYCVKNRVKHLAAEVLSHEWAFLRERFCVGFASS